MPKVGQPDDNKKGSFIYNALKPLKPANGQPLLPFREALGGVKYCGPFNDLSNGDPINKVDSVCRTHDYAYNAAHKQQDNTIAKQMEHQADMSMLKELKQTHPEDFKEHVLKGLAFGGIFAKSIAESPLDTIQTVGGI